MQRAHSFLHKIIPLNIRYSLKIRYSSYYYGGSIYKINYFQNAFRHSSVFGLYAQDNSSKTKSLHLIYVIMLERNFFRIDYCFPSQQLSRPCVKTRPFFRRFHGIMNLLKIHMKYQFNKHKKLVIFHSIIFQMLMHHNGNILFITMKMYH